MSALKTFRVKRILAKKGKQNRPIPQWIRMKTGNTIRYNAKRRHWRSLLQAHWQCYLYVWFIAMILEGNLVDDTFIGVEGLHGPRVNANRWLPTTSFVLLFALKVSLAASLDTAEFGNRLHRKLPILFGVACQFLVCPACGALVTWLLGMEFIPGVVLLVVTSCPGGSFSNWLTQLVNGDLAMSVAMTAFSSMMGLAMLPLNIYIYTKLIYSKEVLSWEQWCAVILAVATVCLALLIGLGLSRCFPSQEARNRFSAVGLLCGFMLFALCVVVAAASNTTAHHGTATLPLWRRNIKVFVLVWFPIVMTTCIMILLTSVDYFRLAKPERVAVVIEAVYQNTALGAAMTLKMFPAHLADAMCVVVLFQLSQGAILTVFGVWAHFMNWTLVSPQEMNLFEAFVGNYQFRAGSGLLELPAK